MNFQFDGSASIYDGNFEYRFPYEKPLMVSLNGVYMSAGLGPKSLEDWKDLRGSAVRYPHAPKGCTLNDPLHKEFMEGYRMMQKALAGMLAEQGMLPLMYKAYYENATYGWTNQGEYTLDAAGNVCIPASSAADLKTLDIYNNHGVLMGSKDVTEVKQIKEQA